jgi:hypothetical protein
MIPQQKSQEAADNFRNLDINLFKPTEWLRVQYFGDLPRKFGMKRPKMIKTSLKMLKLPRICWDLIIPSHRLIFQHDDVGVLLPHFGSSTHLLLLASTKKNRQTQGAMLQMSQILRP